MPPVKVNASVAGGDLPHLLVFRVLARGRLRRVQSAGRRAAEALVESDLTQWPSLGSLAGLGGLRRGRGARGTRGVEAARAPQHQRYPRVHDSDERQRQQVPHGEVGRAAEAEVACR